jgi:hypothetical protein
MVNVEDYSLIQFTLTIFANDLNGIFNITSIATGIVTAVYSNYGTASLLNKKISFFYPYYFIIPY